MQQNTNTKPYQQVYLDAFGQWRNRKKAPQSLLHQLFMTSIRQSLKMEIVFDSSISQIIISSFKSKSRTQQIIQSYDELQSIRDFAHFLHSIKFIQEHHKQQLIKEVDRQMDSQSFRLLQLSKKLDQCSCKAQFQNVWMESSQIHQYQSFWSFYLCDNQPQNKCLLIKIYQSFKKFRINLDMDIREKLDHHFNNIYKSINKVTQINKSLQSILRKNLLQQYWKNNLNQEYFVLLKLFGQFKHSLEVSSFSQQVEFKVTKYGSLENGFATRQSDLDVTILTNCYVSQVRFVQALGSFLRVQMDKSQYKVSVITSASIPIVQIQKIQNYYGKVEVILKIDIAINNICGVINSKFLKMYSQLHIGIRNLGILIKLWAKRANIINQKGMSSYSMMIMMLYYLIKTNKTPNILKSTKQTKKQFEWMKVRRYKRGAKQQFVIPNYYETDSLRIRKLLNFNVYENLLGFMNFYGPEGIYFKQQRSISLDGSYKALQKDKVYTIKDPFDEPHNPGRANIVLKNGYLREFDKACKILKQGDMDEIWSLFMGVRTQF